MVAVINFGSQYAHLIARRIRELGVKAELISPKISITNLKKMSPDAIIFSGSPSSVYEKKAPRSNSKIFGLNIPIIGICYGMQLIGYQKKGIISSHNSKQFGKEIIKIKKSKLFKGLNKSEKVWFSHGDQIDKISSDFTIIGSTRNVKVAAIENKAKKIYGIQFHPEVTHTPSGRKILSNFLFDIAKAKKDWDLKKQKKDLVKNLCLKIKNQKVIMAISGGVDSLVAAVLLKEAIGKNLNLIFIDTGLLRKDETDEVELIVNKVGFSNFKISRSKIKFLSALRGIIDPEEKRKIIAKYYFEIFEEEAKKIKSVNYLAQGTIYPDRIESAQTSKHTAKIKSHHNLTLPKGLKLQMVEPLADFYKDEVRKIGKMLKISSKFLNRHPFPGPGLAIRILGEVTEERLSILREVDSIFISEIKSVGIYNKVGQAFAALLPVKSVGVMGDARTYSYIVSLRSVDTIDWMTADWSKIPYEVLEKISSRIVNEVRGVNRVLYDITQKPPATIEYE